MSLQCDCNCYNCDTRAWKRGYKSTYSYMHVTKKSNYSTTPQARSIHKAICSQEHGHAKTSHNYSLGVDKGDHFPISVLVRESFICAN